MWNTIPREEQETIINLDYLDKKISLYTTRYAVANKLKNKIGEPTKINYSNSKIDSVEYEMSMNDKKARYLLSVRVLLLRTIEKKD